MNFRSDNTAICAPEIMAAINAANEGSALSYGADDLCQSLDERFSALFGREARVFPVISGTAANAVALASATPPWGSIYCHAEAHIERDELGAPEFYTGGGKLVLVGGAMAKVGADVLAQAVRAGMRDEHTVRPAAVSISQATERGAIYRPEEVRAIAKMAHSYRLVLHMDGARFGNAVAALGCAPAEAAADVDLLSFGATKNGAMGAECIVCFDLRHAEKIAIWRKRGGHLISKSRFVAAQLLAYLQDDLWLRLAARSNALAQRLGQAAGPLLSHPVQTNQVFIQAGAAGLARMRAAGADFYEWGDADSGEARLVVAWNQADADIDAMCALLQSLR